MTKADISVVIAEPQQLLAGGLAHLLRSQYPTMQVEITPTWERATVDRCKSSLRTIIINPILAYHDDRLMPRVRRDYPSVAVIALQSAYHPSAFLRQFDDCIDIYTPPEEAIERLAPYILGWEETRGQRPQLSGREIEVLRLLVLGKTAKEIGKELYISEHTVTSHRKNIAEKLGIKTIPGMTIYAVSAHLIELSDLHRLQEKDSGE